jgi:amidase
MSNNNSNNAAPYVLPLLLDATLDELRTGLDSGHFTSVQLVQAYIDRIGEVNSRLKAVTEINPDALSIASQLDNEREQMKNSSQISNLGPLHGIPILVKNNIATHDKMETTAGSLALLGARVPEDSTVVAKLRKSGAIIIGKVSSLDSLNTTLHLLTHQLKVNMTQWACVRDTNCPEGWSAHGGQTRGAYFARQTPKGSSSGSAVATSVGLAWASLATDTGGSITMPATQNNVVGFRPTVGLTSRHLVIPHSLRLDTVGTMTRTVKDAAYLMKAIVGQDAKDPITAQIPFKIAPDYVAACIGTGLQGKRIGISPILMDFCNLFTYDLPEAKFAEALDLMRGARAEIVDGIKFIGPCLGLIAQASLPYYPRNAVDFSTDLPKYLSKLSTNPNNIQSLSDLRDFTQKTPAEQNPFCDTDIWDTVLDMTADEISGSYKSHAAIENKYFGDWGIIGAFEHFKLDAFVTWGPVASMFCSRAGGLPAVTVPLGKLRETDLYMQDDGSADSAPNKPFGITFVGPRYSEETLFGIAYAFEQLTLARKEVRPVFVPRTELADVLKRG